MQNAQRLAPIGISLSHSVHFFVVGSAGGSLRARASEAAKTSPESEGFFSRMKEFFEDLRE